MSDLTNERIAQLIVWAGSDTAKALHELLRHRAALDRNAIDRNAAVSTEYLSAGVTDLSNEQLGLLESECMSIGGERGGRLRAALFELRRHRSALAADMERVRSVVRESTLLVLEDQSATVTRSNAVLRYGTAERRHALEFCADVIATRAAEQLATVSVQLSILERVELDALLEHLVERRETAKNQGQFNVFNDWHTVLVKLLGASK